MHSGTALQRMHLPSWAALGIGGGVGCRSMWMGGDQEKMGASSLEAPVVGGIPCIHGHRITEPWAPALGLYTPASVLRICSSHMHLTYYLIAAHTLVVSAEQVLLSQRPLFVLWNTHHSGNNVLNVLAIPVRSDHPSGVGL